MDAAHSWLNRFRKIPVRYEKLSETYEALVRLGAAIICRRKVAGVYGLVLHCYYAVRLSFARSPIRLHKVDTILYSRICQKA
jgi:hypothetical protein